MSQIRIFCYMPSPRVWKSIIAARLAKVELEIRSTAPANLKDWLWDFDARLLTKEEKTAGRHERKGHTGFKGSTLYKTEAFMKAHPFGTVPAAFSGDGQIGVFESNSIMRAVARVGDESAGLYGDNPYLTSRIDSFLDASLVFARESQVYLLSLASTEITQETYERTSSAFTGYMSAIERALDPDERYLVGDQLSLADICFACEYAMCARELERREVLEIIGALPISHDSLERFPRSLNHFNNLCRLEAFCPELGTYCVE